MNHQSFHLQVCCNSHQPFFSFQSLHVHTESKKQTNQVSIGDFLQENQQILDLLQSVHRKEVDVKEGRSVALKNSNFWSFYIDKHKCYRIIIELTGTANVLEWCTAENNRTYPSPLFPLGSYCEVQKGYDMVLTETKTECSFPHPLKFCGKETVACTQVSIQRCNRSRTLHLSLLSNILMEHRHNRGKSNWNSNAWCYQMLQDVG